MTQSTARSEPRVSAKTKDLILEPAEYDLEKVLADTAEIRRYNRQRFEMEQLTAIVFEDLDRKICVGYRLGGTLSEILPVGAEELERCEPVYEELPGWMESTVGIKSFDKLPKAAAAYLRRIEALAGVPIDLVSTGPDREETIVRRHPYDQ